MPLVIGALTVGMLSVFTLQSTVSNRLTDSGDAQLISVNYQNDIQSAAQITTANAPVSAPAPCEPSSGLGAGGYQILGLQLGNGNEVSYVATKAPTGRPTTSFETVRLGEHRPHNLRGLGPGHARINRESGDAAGDRFLHELLGDLRQCATHE